MADWRKIAQELRTWGLTDEGYPNLTKKSINESQEEDEKPEGEKEKVEETGPIATGDDGEHQYQPVTVEEGKEEGKIQNAGPGDDGEGETETPEKLGKEELTKMQINMDRDNKNLHEDEKHDDPSYDDAKSKKLSSKEEETMDLGEDDKHDDPSYVDAKSKKLSPKEEETMDLGECAECGKPGKHEDHKDEEDDLDTVVEEALHELLTRTGLIESNETIYDAAFSLYVIEDKDYAGVMPITESKVGKKAMTLYRMVKGKLKKISGEKARKIQKYLHNYYVRHKSKFKQASKKFAKGVKKLGRVTSEMRKRRNSPAMKAHFAAVHESLADFVNGVKAMGVLLEEPDRYLNGPNVKLATDEIAESLNRLSEKFSSVVNESFTPREKGLLVEDLAATEELYNQYVDMFGESLVEFKRSTVERNYSNMCRDYALIETLLESFVDKFFVEDKEEKDDEDEPELQEMDEEITASGPDDTIPGIPGLPQPEEKPEEENDGGDNADENGSADGSPEDGDDDDELNGIFIQVDPDEEDEEGIDEPGEAADVINNAMTKTEESKPEDGEDEHEEDHDEDGDEELHESKKWSGKVKTKWHAPEGMWEESAKHIASVVAKDSKNLKQAIDRIVFYKNRAGKNLSEKEQAKLEKAMDLVRKHFNAVEESQEEKGDMEKEEMKKKKADEKVDAKELEESKIDELLATLGEAMDLLDQTEGYTTAKEGVQVDDKEAPASGFKPTKESNSIAKEQGAKDQRGSRKTEPNFSEKKSEKPVNAYGGTGKTFQDNARNVAKERLLKWLHDNKFVVDSDSTGGKNDIFKKMGAKDAEN